LREILVTLEKDIFGYTLNFMFELAEIFVVRHWRIEEFKLPRSAITIQEFTSTGDNKFAINFVTEGDIVTDETLQVLVTLCRPVPNLTAFPIPK